MLCQPSHLDKGVWEGYPGGFIGLFSLHHTCCHRASSFATWCRLIFDGTATGTWYQYQVEECTGVSDMFLGTVRSALLFCGRTIRIWSTETKESFPIPSSESAPFIRYTQFQQRNIQLSWILRRVKYKFYQHAYSNFTREGILRTTNHVLVLRLTLEIRTGA
jgi:hypothetical protein